ncbi:MAG: hypothetical protein RI883_425 [Bacteroidota bacterium]|jgi:hypothetical protein
MKKFIIFSVLTLNVLFVSGQSIFTNPITGASPNTSNPYTTGQTVDANITVSGIGRGTGITGNAGTDRYNATSWNPGGMDINDFFEFTLTPTSGCDIDFVSFVYTAQASGSGPTSFAFRSSLDGYVANIGVPTAGGTTLSLAAAQHQNIGSAITFRFYGWGGSGGTFSINSFTFNGATACSTNTISTSNVTGGPFTVDCSTTDFGTVDFTSTGTFTAGNIYTAQLSDSAGNFSSPVSIGTLASTANSGTINITIPAVTITGAGYRIRVISNTPAAIGSDNGSNIIINLNTCISILPSNGLLINEFSNGSGGSKEYYEFIVVGNCGDLADVRGFIIDDNNGTFSTTFPEHASGVAKGHLRLTNHTQWAAIPVGSLIVIYNGGDLNPSLPPDDPYDLINIDSLYVIPHSLSALLEITNDLPSDNLTLEDSTYSPCTYSGGNWSTLGLANLGDAVQIRSPNGAYYHGVSYGDNKITGGPNDMKISNLSMTGMCGWFSEGSIYDINNWSTGVIAGNETPGMPNNAANNAWLKAMRDPLTVDCAVAFLPTSLLTFQGEYINQTTLLNWQIASEQNNSHFTLSHSIDGYQFNVIGTVLGAGNSSELKDYRFTHNYPHPGINYYKLQSTDYDGKEYLKGTIAVEAEFNFSFYDSFTSTIELSYESDIEIFSMDGKLIQSEMNTSSVFFTKSGLFFIYDKKTGISERLFIP